MKGGLAIAAALAGLTAANPTGLQKRGVTAVTIKGNAFFAGNTRFYIKGVDYQPGGPSKPKDPIADADGCKRDIANFKALGLNTIRVYTVDNSANHDECMNALNDANIYLALDVNSAKYSINREQPQRSYNAMYLQSVFATIEAFAKYDNTLLFFSANEVINDDKSTFTAPWVKAVTRDMKQYMRSRGLRQIPVGYSAADVEANRYDMAHYMNCGDDLIRSDFYAFNDYSWCDESGFQQSGWDQKIAKFGDYNIPLFLSEYGCIKNKRTFGAVKSLYDSDTTAVYSGGLVYQYTEESDNPNFGLVDLNGNSVSIRPDFTALKNAYGKNPVPTSDGGYKTGGSASQCPTKSSTWNVTVAADQLPAFPSDAQKYLKQGAGSGPGLSGPGSQEAGSDTPTLTGATNGVTSGVADPKKTNAAVAPSSRGMMTYGAVVLASSFLGGSFLL